MSAPEKVLSAPPPAAPLRHGVMLVVALLFLLLVAIVLPHGDSGDSFREAARLHPAYLTVLLGAWAFIALESLAGLFLAADAWPARLKRLLLITLLPPIRMTTATSTPPGWLWLPGAGWRPTGPKTTERLEQKLALPMLFLTLLVLPVLGAELGAGEALDKRPTWALAVHLTTCLIWIGFVAEFVWMISATPQKLGYCLRHWINLVIILLPLLAFLRVLAVFRFARFFRAGKLLRAYRLRTLNSRLLRLALLFNLFERIQQRNPEKYCTSLEKKIAELEAELTGMKEKLEAFRVKKAD
ncbi:hypothetical protein WJU23_20145 [Prosthecobacter sp. SYSU 5D2]|uniref:potassium channel protein - like protein n=1 Tax=Prosthecobacter sp. SYSU 5D2 TaxID=3134134 RepID=UPI0031FE8582